MNIHITDNAKSLILKPDSVYDAYKLGILMTKIEDAMIQRSSDDEFTVKVDIEDMIYFISKIQ